jgi:[ribosomal protein S5]-alanine N-acetyltransferase
MEERSSTVKHDETMLTTDRLTIIPCTIEMMRAIVIAPQDLSMFIGATIPRGWPEADLVEALPYFVSELEKDPQAYVWLVWIIISKTDNVLIGSIGFRGKPNSGGTIELGYGILPEYRNRGFAFEAAQALVNWAKKMDGVKKITAECAPENSPSVRILDKLNMVRSETPGSGGNALFELTIA